MEKDKQLLSKGEKREQESHAWRGSWNRPMKIDENSLDPLTIARMTDHNVRGGDREEDLPAYIPAPPRSREDQAA